MPTIRQAGGPFTGRGNFRFTWYGARIVQGLLDAQQRAAQRTADWAVALAKSLVPVDTGYLRSTITFELRQTATGFALVILAGADYALYVELGTSRMSAQPYLRPVLDRIGARYRQFLAEETRRVA